MAFVIVNGKTYEADLLVFDKDGLMFDSEAFWIELANARMRALAEYCSTEQLLTLAGRMGVRTTVTPAGTVEATWADHSGILAIAPPTEEVVLVAAYLSDIKGLMWHEARTLAAEVFRISDADMDMTRAVQPMPGYIKLMTRLNDLGIPYGVATSDNAERTRVAMDRYGFYKNVRFIVTSDDVTEGKPAPDMLRFIAEKENVPASRIAMFGDSYVDVQMAKAAGSIGIGVTTAPDMQAKMRPFATEIVPSLDEITVAK